jgi:hypothetical protein
VATAVSVFTASSTPPYVSPSASNVRRVIGILKMAADIKTTSVGYTNKISRSSPADM